MARKPTHRLKVLHKETGKHGEVGVGWENASTGAISIVINPQTVLHWRDMQDCVLTLFPAGDAELAGGRPPTPPILQEAARRCMLLGTYPPRVAP